MNPAQLLSAIRSLPGDIERLADGLADDLLRRRCSPGDWSMIEICCHLRDSGEISTLRIQRLATEDTPTLDPYDEQALAIERHYQDDDLGRVLPAMRSAWNGLGETLADLPPEAWQRAGHHPERGTVTIASEALRYAEHAREHTEQMKMMLTQLPLPS
jgi:hypothetical protein